MKLAAMSKKLKGSLGCDSNESSKSVDQSDCRSAVSGKFFTAMGKLASATDCHGQPGCLPDEAPNRGGRR